jgi:hypothetical protein
MTPDRDALPMTEWRWTPEDGCPSGCPEEGHREGCPFATYMVGMRGTMREMAAQVVADEAEASVGGLDEQMAAEYERGWNAANALAARGAEARAGVPDAHPDDGHAHHFTCIRCGVNAPAEARAGGLDVIRAALTSEDEIAHGEAYEPSRGGLGVCAYCDGEWPCRTQQGINRLLARLAAEETP